MKHQTLCQLMVVLLLVGLTFSAWTCSPTIDEVAHLPAGLAVWQLSSFELYCVNPPLVKAVAAAPLTLFDPITDWDHAGGAFGDRSDHNRSVESPGTQRPGGICRFTDTSDIAVGSAKFADCI